MLGRPLHILKKNAFFVHLIYLIFGYRIAFPIPVLINMRHCNLYFLTYKSNLDKFFEFCDGIHFFQCIITASIVKADIWITRVMILLVVILLYLKLRYR